MIRITVRVSGMMCGMCEAHIINAVRTAFRVRKVTSSRKKGETVILSDGPADMEKLRKVIGETGHVVLSAREEETGKEKGKWFASLLKR